MYVKILYVFNHNLPYRIDILRKTKNYNFQCVTFLLDMDVKTKLKELRGHKFEPAGSALTAQFDGNNFMTLTL